jgi:hypothetical protein
VGGSTGSVGSAGVVVVAAAAVVVVAPGASAVVVVSSLSLELQAAATRANATTRIANAIGRLCLFRFKVVSLLVWITTAARGQLTPHLSSVWFCRRFR